MIHYDIKGFLKILFFYLAVLGHSCGMWDLQLQYVGSGSLTKDLTWSPYVESEVS